MHLWGSMKRPMAWSWQAKKFKILNDLRWTYDINFVNYDGEHTRWENERLLQPKLIL